ncbi:MAG TPA: cupredoxin domain-containing protein [bacterium]|nr:cupredoxin domain-containing protein [bacterium]
MKQVLLPVIMGFFLFTMELLGCSQITSPQEQNGSDNYILVKGKEFSLNPDKITLTVDSTASIIFANVGTIAHNLAIGEFNVQSRTIQPNTRDTITFTPDTTGRFPMWCDVPGHRDAGMEGIVIVGGR